MSEQSSCEEKRRKKHKKENRDMFYLLIFWAVWYIFYFPVNDFRIKEFFKMNFTYIVRCSDGSLYTGWTTDLDKRIRAHNEKKGAKYTKTRTPVELVYFEEKASKVEAMQREAAIKKLPKSKKEELVKLFSAKPK